MKYLFFSLIALCLIFGCESEEDEDDSPENLLEDPEFEQWKKQGDITAKMTDEVLELSGDGGWMFYDEEFEDFHFETEFLVDENQTAAVAFRHLDNKKCNPAFVSYKVMIDFNLDQQNPIGSIYNVSRAKTLKSAQASSWNKLGITAQGDHLKVFVNDTLVTETHNRRSLEGMIGLQAGNLAKFRNTTIQSMEEEDYLGPMLEDYMRAASKDDLKPLSNGVDLSQWSQIGDANWDIQDGVIHGYSGEKGGFLIHQDAYRNFYLKLKFRLKHEENSGIFIRHNPADADAVSTDNGIECNIYDHDGFLHEYSTGSIAPIARAWSKMITYDDWNDMEIFAFGNHVVLTVNGAKSSEAHSDEIIDQKGNICIQGGIQVFNGNLPSHIYVKDMFIKDFDDVPFIGF